MKVQGRAGLKLMFAHLGGAAAVARKLELASTTVQAWSDREVPRIPIEHWRKFIVLGQQAGMNLDAEKMLSLYEGDEIDV